ncbi:MAG TPA: pyruvate dehydrogenase (acetyl-transferring) E1 component subunit alpha [Candidatus Angelobacter sp.]|jgi:pyruvate dehydrogenase E1 component alpha subunit|nr:pyruvate dehydrogenase (acetyl-transferring) E1 component subunit alpha [Candidatus Angelobacter sp.]
MAKATSRPSTTRRRSGRTEDGASAPSRRRHHATIAGLDAGTLLTMYRQMLLIRRFEEHAAEAYSQAKIGGFLHLYIGEEAVAVGALHGARPDDHLITHYRDHGYALVRGCEPGAVMAELFGRATGVVGGRGGSMHLADASKHFWGGHAIVGGHIPVAVGLALAQQKKQTGLVVVDVFGDGATAIGMFHEAMNMAMIWRAPVVFLCENNLYGMGATLVEQSPVARLVERARGYNMPAAQADGMDPVDMRRVMHEATEHARRGEGPFFVEALTYRFRGHSMADPEMYRTREEVREWRAKDPIPAFAKRLVDAGVAGEEELQRLDAEVEEQVLAAVRFADESPPPDPATVFDKIYAAPLEKRP